MDTISHFRTIEELVKMLDREKVLFRDMFEKRKSLENQLYPQKNSPTPDKCDTDSVYLQQLFINVPRK